MLLYRIFAESPIDASRALAELPQKLREEFLVREAPLEQPPSYPPGSRPGTDERLDRYARSRLAYEVVRAGPDGPDAAKVAPAGLALAARLAALAGGALILDVGAGTLLTQEEAESTGGVFRSIAEREAAQALIAKVNARRASAAAAARDVASAVTTATTEISSSQPPTPAAAGEAPVPSWVRADLNEVRLPPGVSLRAKLDPSEVRLPPGVSLRAKLSVEDEMGLDLMWLEVRRWRGGTMTGALPSGEPIDWRTDAVLGLAAVVDGVVLGPKETLAALGLGEA